MFYTLNDRSPREWHIAIDRHLGSSFRAALCFTPNADWHEDGSYTRFSTLFPNPFSNIIWNANFPHVELDGAIESAIAPIAAHGVPILWLAGPSSQPANLADRLLAHGFHAGFPMPAMAVDLNRVGPVNVPEGFDLHEVCDEDGMQDWLAVMSAGYELPPEVAKTFGYWPAHLGLSDRSPMRAFLASRHGVPAACSMLFLDDGVAGIYCVATTPEMRRQGLASAVTTLPLLLARDLGYRVGVLQASQMGEGAYRKIGFESYGTIPMLVHPGRLGKPSSPH